MLNQYAVDFPRYQSTLSFPLHPIPCPMAHFVRSLFLRPRNFQHVCLWAQTLGSSIDVSFGSAICSDVTDASTAETFSVSFTLPSTFAFAWFLTGFNEDLFAFFSIKKRHMGRCSMTFLPFLNSKRYSSPSSLSTDSSLLA